MHLLSQIYARERAQKSWFFVTASKNGTEMKAPRKEKMQIGFSSIRGHRSAKDGLKRRSGQQGGQKGEERQHGKGTNCGAHFTYKLSVRIRYEHNHAISSPDAWNFPDVSEETKTRYFQLFSDAFSPAKASESQTWRKRVVQDLFQKKRESR